MRRIVFTGGGTGGHIFPGLAIVSELSGHEDIDCVWIGNSKGIDRTLVENAKIPFYGISSGKLRRYASFQNFIDLFKIGAGFFQSFFLLRKLRPSLVFSKGGFVSVPPCIAAKLLGIPVITHECDYSPGLATKINSRFASKIFVTYEETRSFFPEKLGESIVVTGNPVRAAFYSGDPEKGIRFSGFADPTRPVLFVLGGSLGARQINALIRDSIVRLCESFNVVHQTGASNEDQAIDAGDPAIIGRYKSFSFIRDEMSDVLASSTLVIARSGANTVWECAAAGKPMILVPLMKGNSRGDQVENASYFVRRGAAVMLAGSDASPAKLLEAVEDIIGNSDKMRIMAEQSKSLGTIRSATSIAEHLLAFAGSIP